ncbi:hypothetical protein HQN87_03730 [Paenibacillus tritici]|uniref:Addiction module toxin RelE n=1 Tax=Paenibacillus tritici TaxID=1873425 RepID=A0ABX2DK27_9BACL|nr:hypothetical protein [Paenibacillus tritici]NQX44434.1 hypothetical protein [Paenibacillus tritici]
MEVRYLSEKEEENYQNIKYLRKKHGEIMAKSIQNRISQIESLDSVGVLLDTKIGKAHMLDHEYKYHIGLNLTGNYRLIIKPVYEEHTDFSELNLHTIFIVTIMEVKDYHGK